MTTPPEWSDRRHRDDEEAFVRPPDPDVELQAQLELLAGRATCPRPRQRGFDDSLSEVSLRKVPCGGWACPEHGLRRRREERDALRNLIAEDRVFVVELSARVVNDTYGTYLRRNEIGTVQTISYGDGSHLRIVAADPAGGKGTITAVEGGKAVWAALVKAMWRPDITRFTPARRGRDYYRRRAQANGTWTPLPKTNESEHIQVMKTLQHRLPSDRWDPDTGAPRLSGAEMRRQYQQILDVMTSDPWHVR